MSGGGDLRSLSGEELRREAKRADRKLGQEIARIHMTDAQFKAVLDWSLEVEAEQLRRRVK